MALGWSLVFLAVGVALLVKGANFLVDNAVAIARRLKIPVIIIGLTIVSFGTSLPEFIIDLAGIISGNGELALGNIIGSNITNVLLILGLSAIIFPLVIKKTTFKFDLPFAILVQLVLLLLVADHWPFATKGNFLNRADGLILLMMCAIFIFYTLWTVTHKKIIEPTSQFCRLVQKTCYAQNSDLTKNQICQKSGFVCKPIRHSKTIKKQSAMLKKHHLQIFRHQKIIKNIGLMIVGLVGLVVGGELVIVGAEAIAIKFGISKTIIGLTIVSLGTSLPELVTSVVAALKKHADIIVGNVVGSGILNVTWILGLSAILKPVVIVTDLKLEFLLNIGVMVLIYIFALIAPKNTHVITRCEGWILLIMYFAYIGFTFYQAMGNF